MYADADMVPKRLDSTNQKRLPANSHAHRDVLQARLICMARDGEVKQRQHFVITETQFAKLERWQHC